MISVFFYGLFMDETVLAAKGVRPEGSVVGYVDGFSLHIGERATLLREKGGRAYGVLMQAAAEHVAALYSEPGVEDYVAEPVVVHLPEDVEVSAVCYILPVAKPAGPNPEYAAALLQLAERLGLPESYLGQIRQAGVAAASP